MIPALGYFTLYRYYVISLLCYIIITLYRYYVIYLLCNIVITLYYYYSGVTRLLLRCICVCSPLDYVIIITLSLLRYPYHIFLITLYHYYIAIIV